MDDMRHVEVQIAEVRAGLSAGFNAINQRFDDAQSNQERMHEENAARLVRIEDEVRQTNGRVTRLEAQQGALDRRPASRDGRDGRDAREITLPALKWWLTIIGASIGATWWFLQTIGFHR
jgi:hypothetical protein